MKTDQTNAQSIRVLFDEEKIAARIKELSREIAGAEFHDLLVIPILKGSFVFAADLLRALHRAGLVLEVDFLSLSSYRAATTSSGQVEIVRDVESDVAGRSVVLIDDILESGRTAFAKDLMAARGAKGVSTCVLLNKPGKLATDLEADFVGFECPDLFVVGYGMDMAHSFRELPYVGVVENP
jgi:hypoxanthine phosphoribosyltransferase